MTAENIETRQTPVGYMERTRLYYRALGYDNDYVWAQRKNVPFAALQKPLSQSRATVITTSSPPEGPPEGNPRLKKVWSIEIDRAPSDLHTENLAWDKEATHTRDRESYLPLNALEKLFNDGQIGALSEHFHGVPTTYSQKQTLEEDAPEILERCRTDGAEIAFLVPL